MAEKFACQPEFSSRTLDMQLQIFPFLKQLLSRIGYCVINHRYVKKQSGLTYKE